MKLRTLLTFTITAVTAVNGLNLPPFFTADMNQHTLTENTPVGSAIYTLQGKDPEGSRVKYGLQGTDQFAVDPNTGVVTVTRPIDRESQTGISDNEIRFSVIIQDEVDEGMDNVVSVPISVIILDENDNMPRFKGTPYKMTVNEDTPVGTTIFSAIEAQDVDLVGDILDVQCLPPDDETAPDLCDYFEIVPRDRDTDIDMFRGSIVLSRPFDYRQRQIYQIKLGVFDGRFNDTAEVVFTIIDVQNSPPIFEGSLTGVANEDDPVGSVIMKVTAKDGDTGRPRRIIYELLDNPQEYFSVDINTGEIRIDKPLDREALAASSGVLNLRVRASELINGQPGTDDLSSTTAEVTITIRDVNDEAPKFNQPEYRVSIPENVPFGTPLVNLNMEVKDSDTGTNSVFSLRLEDPSGKFSIDPVKAVGHTAVSIKVNSKRLDFENPNERKFLLLVVATEEQTEEKLNSTANVIVEIEDINDNNPEFERESYTADISETAPPGSKVILISARDLDSGEFGTAGLRYQLSGNGAELFDVDETTGLISVADCPTPGTNQCLDFEQTSIYFLSFSATDSFGEGKRNVANLRITLKDENDNAPQFELKEYNAGIDEGEIQFQPSLVVKATDVDLTSELAYAIVDGNLNDLFTIDGETGEIKVKSRAGLRVEVTDGVSADYAMVNIKVRDVNDREPVFEKPEYKAMLPEDISVGAVVEQVKATDADFGINQEVSYRIKKGAYDDFAIDLKTGEVKVSGELDFDTRPEYTIEIEAFDGGEPTLSGTAVLKIEVMNRNNKLPYFLPFTQRVQITEDTEPETKIFQLNAIDEDVADVNSLQYSIIDPIVAVDKDGQPVESDAGFANLLRVDNQTGAVFLAEKLDRNSVAVITLNVQVTDTSADPPQNGVGNLVLTIIDVNDFPPEFPAPWMPELKFIPIDVKEELPLGSVVHTFTATDKDSNIARFEIKPANTYFGIEKGTGKLFVKKVLDYEELEDKRLTFDLQVYDAGIPEMSAEAVVIVNLINVNDQSPIFEESMYSAEVEENAARGTPIITVKATDLDEGDFGKVTYQLEGTYQNDFSIDPEEGTISVVNTGLLDREKVENLILQVVSIDSGPTGSRRSSTVPVNITITDVNDNSPTFVEKQYRATIVDNIPYFPEASPIVQVSATDSDVGLNSELFYAIVNGNEEELFRIDNSSGVIYPNNSFLGQRGREFNLVIQVQDEAGLGPWPTPDEAGVYVLVESVNTHKPRWSPAPPLNETVIVQEESSEMVGAVFKTVYAVDQDGDDNENGRISYFFKVKNENVLETDEFSIDEQTGEIRVKVELDREVNDHYELVVIARDHGTPVAFETLRFLNVIVEDIDDHSPVFVQTGSSPVVRFTVPEEEQPGYLVGRVLASDPDVGFFGRIYYYILKGNEGTWFSIDKIQGNIYTKKKLDREERDSYTLLVKATNDAGLVCEPSHCDIDIPDSYDNIDDPSIIQIEVIIQDINDNMLQFSSEAYYVGVPFDSKVGDLIMDVTAYDPDIDNGKVSYSIKSSNLYRQGETQSAGSLVPSPFRMSEGGSRLLLDSLMAEYNQQRFEINIEAREHISGHVARATVYLWIYEPSQQVKLVLNRDPMSVDSHKEEIIRELRNVTDGLLVIDDVRYHVSPAEGLRRDMTDMYIHVVDPDTFTITDPDNFVKAVDSNYDHLAHYYADTGIDKVVPAEVKSEKVVFDSNLVALIALLIALILGLVTFAVVTCCLRYWVMNASSRPRKLAESPRPMMMKSGPGSIMDGDTGGLNGTDNPLWIDQENERKYKAYEEQELTMTVMSDQDNSVISGNGGSGNSRRGSVSHETQSNAYATINKLPMAPSSRRSLFNGSLDITDHERDYVTLDRASRGPIGPVIPEHRPRTMDLNFSLNWASVKASLKDDRFSSFSSSRNSLFQVVFGLPGITSTPMAYGTANRHRLDTSNSSNGTQDSNGMAANYYGNPDDGEPQIVGNLS